MVNNKKFNHNYSWSFNVGSGVVNGNDHESDIILQNIVVHYLRVDEKGKENT